MLRRAFNRFDDWLVCMVSSQLHQAEQGFDDILTNTDGDFSATGLKTASVLRLSRLAVVDGRIIVGSLGNISSGRLMSIRQKIANWLVSK